MLSGQSYAAIAFRNSPATSDARMRMTATVLGLTADAPESPSLKPAWIVVRDVATPLEATLDELFADRGAGNAKAIGRRFKRKRGWGFDSMGHETYNGRACCGALLIERTNASLLPDTAVIPGYEVECPSCGTVFQYVMKGGAHG